MRVATLLPLAAALCAAGQAFGQLPSGTARPTPPPANSPAPPQAKSELPPPYVTRTSDVEIPFSVKESGAADRQPAAVRVFVSWDRGQAWHFYEEKKPTDGRFRFQPKQDGEYWFATQTVDRTGASDNPQPREPQLRLVIDTQKPQLLVQASVVRAGEVTLVWSASDPTLQPTSLKIEYQSAASGSGPWQEVPLDAKAVNIAAGQLSGRTTFEPQVSGKSILLRAEVADAAGNMAYYSQRLSLSPPRVAQAEAGRSPPLDQTATHWPGDNQFEAPRNDDPRSPAASGPSSLAGIVSNPFSQSDSSAGSRRDTFASAAAPGVASGPPDAAAFEALPAPSAGREALQQDSLTASGRNVSSDQSHSAPFVAPLPAPAPAGSDGADDIGPIPFTPQPEQLPAYTPPATTTGEDIVTPQGSQPRFTNSRRFSLDYDVLTVGPEGLDDVELWGTSDGGRTWAKWGSDPDKQSPFDVEVNGEAVYGFRVVILGKSGLASNAPHSGDTADIWVGIDLSRPKARLVSAAYGQGQAAGKLDIRWEAEDANLASRPVTLSIGDRPDGPFAPIAAGLPNSGQYYWEYDPRSPRLIYLRLEVRDQAGNVAIDQLTEPIRVEGLQPQGRIRGFVPGNEPPIGAQRSGVRRQPLAR